jgi:uncharacterized protein YndB with AHSA1/START domain
MAVSSVRVDAPTERVWSALTTPETYPRWLAGAKRIRHVEQTWPEQGSSFHHTVGVGPLTVKDTTTVKEIDPPRRLVLKVRARPVGEGMVTFVVAPEGDGTIITVEEHPLRTAVDFLTRPVLEASIRLRNDKSLRNLRKLLEDQRV